MGLFDRSAPGVSRLVEGVAARARRARLTRALKESPAGRAVAEQAARLELYRPAVIIGLRVDLTIPGHRLRAADHAELAEKNLRVEPLQAGNFVPLCQFLEAEAPARLPTVRHRFATGCRGFVLCEGDRVIGSVFAARGGSADTPPVHPDLEWLPFRPGPDDVYTFDYFVADQARGVGRLFVRGVQEAQAAEGLRSAFGYVYADNTAALWLYRTTGWREVSRVVEHRLLRRLLVVDRTLFVLDWRRVHTRVRVGRLA